MISVWLAAAVALVSPFAQANDLFGIDLDHRMRAQTSCTHAEIPHTDFPRMAAALGATVENGHCRYSLERLAELEASVTGSPTEESMGDWACVMLEDNFARDTMTGCTTDVARTFSERPVRPRAVFGRMAYVGLVQKKYKYTIGRQPDGTTKIKVRVAFRSGLANDEASVEEMRKRMKQAAAFWTNHSPGQTMRFEFEVVAPGTGAGIEVGLVDGPSRGPYDTEWTTDWDWRTVAHEMGHVMGLDDEYDQIRSSLEMGTPGVTRDRCSPLSLMCDNHSVTAVPWRYHYYLIARRMFCDNPGPFDLRL